MVSDRESRRSRIVDGKKSWRDRLLRTRLGQLFLLFVGLRILAALGVAGDALGTISTLGLWIYAIAFVFWGLARLRIKLLWKIRRKLIISYLLIGWFPPSSSSRSSC